MTCDPSRVRIDFDGLASRIVSDVINAPELPIQHSIAQVLAQVLAQEDRWAEEPLNHDIIDRIVDGTNLTIS